MGKSVHDDVLDTMLNYIVDEGDQLCICDTEPTTKTEADTTYMLAKSSVNDISATAPGAPVVSGRKIIIPENFAEGSALTITNGGTAAHVAIIDSVGGVLLYVTTCTAQTLTGGGNVTVPAWNIEVRDPT